MQDYREMNEINGRLNGLWEEDEVYWYQMARVNWLNMWDSNIKIFHQSTMQMRQKKKRF